jgi:ParB family transcriptional regulator, chromosome partitioning protein
MTADIKKRGLGRGLDALFRDMKKDDASHGAAAQSAPSPQAPASVKRADDQTPVKRADEMVAAAQSLQQQKEKAATTGGTPATINGGTPAATTNGQGLRKIAVERLKPGAFQPRRRFDEAALNELAASISTHGVVQPLLVRPLPGGFFEIIAGERRWRAAQKARVHEVPAVVRELTDREALEIGLIENLQRADLSAIEEAEGFSRLIDDFSRTAEDIAQQLGKSRSHVANTLRLLKLPKSVQALVQDGKISAGHARALINAKDPDSIARLIVAQGLSVRDAEKLAQADHAPGQGASKKKKSFIQKDVDILALEQTLARQLGLKVEITHGPTGGHITVQYKKMEQLDDVIARLKQTPQKRI